MPEVRIAEEYDDFGGPVYTTTLRRVIGQIMETNTVRIDAEADQLAAYLSEATGRHETNNRSTEEAMISDAFFNCEFVNEMSEGPGIVRGDESEEFIVALNEAAERFWEALPEPYRVRFTPEWLIDDFMRRV